MKDDLIQYPTKEPSLVGAAGVHAIVSELSLRGLIALPTIRNTAGVDVIVSNKAGTWHANLQVKTSRQRVSFWPVGERYSEWIGPNNFYVFLRFDNKTGQFEVFLESSSEVANNCDAEVMREKEKGLKRWTPCFYPRNSLEHLKAKWTQFGKEAAQSASKPTR